MSAVEGLAAWCAGVVAEWWTAALDELLHFQSWPSFWGWVGEYALLFPAGMCVVWMAFGLRHVLALQPRLPWAPPERLRLRVAVVVPARNEEQGIEGTLASLLEQDHPHMTVHVVCDACTDATAERARTFAGRGVVVHELSERRGKAGALQYVLDRIDDELFLVVDADTRCEPPHRAPDGRLLAPGTVTAMVQQFADGHIAGVTGSPRIAAPRGLLARLQALEYVGVIGLIKRADSFWGGLFTVSGAGACFRSAVLRDVGGWSSASVTEDIEMSWRVQKAGHQLVYEPRALFWLPAVEHLDALWRQRTRWARGMLEVMLRHGNIALTGNAALIPMAAQVLGTMIWMLFAVATTVVWLTGIARSLLHGQGFDGTTALRVLVLTTALFVCQTVLASLWDRRDRHDTLKHGLLAFVFPLYYWGVILPSFVLGLRALLRGRRTRDGGLWERTDRPGQRVSDP